jgi:alpha-beta hydrolase superfamily lysophospholipase
MYEPFPGNYVWNLSINLALCMGGAIGEMEAANTRIRAAAGESEDGGTEAFFSSWCDMADRLRSLGDEDAAADRRLSAAEKYGRACVYYMTAERMQSRHYRPRQTAYGHMLEMADRWISLGGLPCERVDIPYEGSSFPGLLATVPRVANPPCMVFCNGLDSVKEMIYRCGIAQELQRRGIATLMIDHPGVGEALRLRGLTAVHDSERWAGAAVDFLERGRRVDASRVGMMGWSLGGYYAPRAAAFEKRFRLCVAWGANHNWGELQRKRLAREGDRPVPHYWDHVMWVWGKDTLEEFMAFAPQVSLVGVVKNITVPFLITHGAHDRQIPLAYAHQCYEEAVNSPKRELKIFTDREGGVEHVSADNMEPVRSYIADWIERTFANLSA